MTPVSSDSHVGWDSPLGIGSAGPSSLGGSSIRPERSQRGWLSEAQCWQLAHGEKRFYLGGYRLQAWLGSGGMGQVFRAHDLRLGRIVAIKVLPPRASRQRTQRFLREMRAAGALQHPHIVETLDADSDGDVQFLVMELAPGMDLRRWLNRHGPLPIAWACECARQTAEALHYAHTHGIFHRDVKPANIVVQASNLTSRPAAKLLDLGLARFTDPELTSLTGLHQQIGTPDYLAPELVGGLGHAADARSEVFSLGATLFELLTGAPPERGETSVLGHRAAAPPALAAVITRMLAPKPEDRYATLAEAAQAIVPFAWRDEAPAKVIKPAPAAPRVTPRLLSLDDVVDEPLVSAPLLADVLHELQGWMEADRRAVQTALAMALSVSVLLGMVAWLTL